MSTVTLSIGPKSYAVACADGEEAHIATLGAVVAEKYAKLGTSRAPLEAQNLLFAALFLADELAEARKLLAAAPAPAPASVADPEAVEALRLAITQLEGDLAAARANSGTPAPFASDPDVLENAEAGLETGQETLGAIADQLEALATRAEAAATALEAAADNA